MATHSNIHAWRISWTVITLVLMERDGHGEIWWNKKYELRIVNWKKLSKTSSFLFFLVSHLGKKQCFFPQGIKRTPLIWGSYGHFEGQGKDRRPCFCHFLILQFIHFAKVPYLQVAHPEHHHCIVLEFH